MNWCVQGHPEHDGYVAGLLREGRGWREFHQRDPKGLPVKMIAAACACGWRGPRRRAPTRAVWLRFLVGELTGKAQQPLYEDWLQHIRETLGPLVGDNPGGPKTYP